MKWNRKRAFTLVELLTVIAIIGIIAAFVFPTLRKARDKAKMAKCANNLIQFAHAIDLFKIENDDFPNWLSNLYPSYVSSNDMYLCPGDYCMQGDKSPNNSHRGADGGKPLWEPGRRQFTETDDTKFNGGPNWPRNSKEGKIDYCSYLYEFSQEPCSWKPGYTWREARNSQMTGPSHGKIPDYGIPVPSVSCFWHQKQKSNSNNYAKGPKNVINVAAGEKNIFYTDASTDSALRWR